MGDHIFQNHVRPQGIAHTDVFPNNYELCIMNCMCDHKGSPLQMYFSTINCMCDHKGLPLQMYFPTITNYAL